jgi:phthiocerol/phenolphthiocerol synthesis type-I polyketide synthase E
VTDPTNLHEDPLEGAGDEGFDVAIVGMAARFPKARDLDAFWANLTAGVCSVTRFSPEELIARGVSPDTAEASDYVPVAYLLEDSDRFDAEFFGYSPREAELMDPQHRVLLECAWSAVEDAGLDPARYEGAVGIFAGAGHNTYLVEHVAPRRELIQTVGGKQVLLGNRADFLTSRVSHKLGLGGPSVTVQSACSTSLVAVVQACQSLLSYQCDAALAGGVAVDASRHDGYVYRDDGILSPDGYTRTLDARAQGTVGADGVGLVVLKRLADALAEGDHVRAVIKGSAVNNDGSRRAGFSAPSATAQAAAINRALAEANVEPETVRYVELHGTATALGDPIEMAALRSVYTGVAPGHCLVGSVKTNVGHLDAAAGVAGLIKTVLMLEHGQVVPSLNFERPNSRLKLADSPFAVATELGPWPDGGHPRRAGVSSFGLGGTNAHVVLEQAPAIDRPHPRPGAQLLVFSARTEAALQVAVDRMADHLRANPDARLDDVAATLQRGRAMLPCRRAVVASAAAEACAALEAADDGRLFGGTAPDVEDRPVAFMFGGFGSQHPGMARELYGEPVFRAALDECAELSRPHLGEDLRDVLLTPAAESPDQPDLARLLLPPEMSDHAIHQPAIGYPAVFAFEYALARLWESWGIRPEAMIGHSLGEYVAACLAGVFELEDALRLVIERARLMEQHGEGAMLAVPLAESELEDYLGDETSLAAVNDPHTCVLSGTTDAVQGVVEALDARGVVSRRLSSPYAFHSPMMEPVVAPYADVVATVRLSPPRIPFVSNVTGTWITTEQATDPSYWARHLRLPVRFIDGVGELWRVPDVALLEIAVGQSLTASALQHPDTAESRDRLAVASLPGAFGGEGARASLLRAAGRLWLAGRRDPFPPGGTGRRTPLPTYPFARRRFWLEPLTSPSAETYSRSPARRTAGGEWLAEPVWTRAPAGETGTLQADDGPWLIFADGAGLGARIADRLRATGADVVTVTPDIGPSSTEGYRALAQTLRAEDRFPARLVHCWGVDPGGGLSSGFESLVRWAQAAEAELMSQPTRWDVVTTGVCSVLGTEVLSADKAAVRGVCQVLSQEYPSATCVHVDVEPVGPATLDALADRVVAHLGARAGERSVALRGTHRWVPGYVPTAPVERPDTVRPGGTYLITGGLGRIGLVAARALAARAPVRLVLLGRTPAPGPKAVEAIRAVEALGCRVDVVSADVTDRDQMREVVAGVIAECGGIDGVVHCAGTTGERAHRAIADIGDTEAGWHFGPKLRGTEILMDLVADQNLSVALLCSSVASVLGGLGFAAYAGANACVDALAQARRGPGQPWTSVVWEAWRFPSEDGEDPRLGAAVAELALSPVEGQSVFDRLLSGLTPPVTVVSTGDIAARRALWSSPGVEHEPAESHERPTLHNPYVAPGTETERQICAIWEHLLGVESVGIHDNFFELGGTSLLGLQVTQRLRERLKMPIPLSLVYEGPTVSTLAGLADQMRSQR